MMQLEQPIIDKPNEEMQAAKSGNRNAFSFVDLTAAQVKDTNSVKKKPKKNSSLDKFRGDRHPHEGQGIKELMTEGLGQPSSSSSTWKRKRWSDY